MVSAVLPMFEHWRCGFAFFRSSSFLRIAFHISLKGVVPPGFVPFRCR